MASLMLAHRVAQRAALLSLASSSTAASSTDVLTMHRPTRCQRDLASKKGIEAKVNTKSWAYRLKDFFTPNLMDSHGESRPSRRWSPDHRELTSAEWMAQGIHKSVRIFLRYHCIVPDLLPEPVLPSVNLLVSYGQTHWDLVYRGNFLHPLDTLKRPSVTIKSDTLKPDAFYTLLMVTPDEPSRSHPQAHQKLLWCVADIPGSQPDLAGGRELLSYVHPLPLKNSGNHRYAFFLVEQQQGAMPADFAVDAPEPGQFSVHKFIGQHRLAVVGLSFFQLEYTPELAAYYEQRGIEEPYLETEADVKNRIVRAERLENLANASRNKDPS